MILVRHSTPEMRADVPAAQWRLSPDGQTRAQALAERLVQFKPGAVCCSPETKAAETAAIIAAALRLPCDEIADLAEHNRANVPFLTKAEFEAGITEFFRRPKERVFGLESADEALLRFEAGLAQALRVARSPVVVTHGTVLSLYLARTTGVDALTIWKRLETPCYFVSQAGPYTV